MNPRHANPRKQKNPKHTETQSQSNWNYVGLNQQVKRNKPKHTKNANQPTLYTTPTNVSNHHRQQNNKTQIKSIKYPKLANNSNQKQIPKTPQLAVPTANAKSKIFKQVSKQNTTKFKAQNQTKAIGRKPFSNRTQLNATTTKQNPQLNKQTAITQNKTNPEPQIN